MKSKKFGFLKHYRKIKIEGFNLNALLNKCIEEGIVLKNLRWNSKLESTAEVKAEDYGRLGKAAGYSYKMSVEKEGGMIPFFGKIKANIVTVTGAFLLGAFIFYQGMFVAEVRVSGYESISEESIRSTLENAGLYEGVKKPDNYNDAKAALYREHDKITWVSIYEDGRLIKVQISEASDAEDAVPADDTPVNIVAEKSGIIESVQPLQGNADVQKGDYVSEGDVLINGAFEYQSSDYSRGDEVFTMYSHAKGSVYARVPKQLTYYFEKNERKKEPTGRWMAGLYLKVGNMSFDTVSAFCRYEASVRNEKTLVDLVKPVPLTVELVKIDEVKVTEKRTDSRTLNEVTEAALRQYKKENLGEGKSLVNNEIEYSDTANMIKANVFIETIEEIGIEKVIKVKKTDKNNEEKADE